MRSLPLNIQILAAPLVLAIPIVFILIYTLVYLTDISKQNDTVREWARATDQIKIAQSTSYQMLHTLTELSSKKNITDSDKKEELFFNYIEQSQVLKSSLTSADIGDKISNENLTLFSKTIQTTRYSERMDILSSIRALETLSPKLDYIYNTLQAKKRVLYIKSNKDITLITSKLTNVILLVLGISTLLALITAGLVSKTLKRRLTCISQYATNVLKGNYQALQKPTNINDELDQITLQLSKMSQKLSHTIASEDILQAAEDERQRIAMDIHDQFLSEITQLRREIEQADTHNNSAKQLQTIDDTLGRLNTDLRSLINDLFPHSLEILGLEASIRDYILRKLSAFQNIQFYVQIDANIDDYLTQKQCLHLYRISIEAINNILKHAHCNRFELVLKRIDGNIVLSIEDNGCGFDFTSTEPLGHIGMLSIKQRASILETEGHWQASRFSTGTCFKLILYNTRQSPDATSIASIQTSAYV